jgi:hypothetical protein
MLLSIASAGETFREAVSQFELRVLILHRPVPRFVTCFRKMIIIVLKATENTAPGAKDLW